MAPIARRRRRAVQKGFAKAWATDRRDVRVVTPVALTSAVANIPTLRSR